MENNNGREKDTGKPSTAKVGGHIPSVFKYLQHHFLKAQKINIVYIEGKSL